MENMKIRNNVLWRHASLYFYISFLTAIILTVTGLNMSSHFMTYLFIILSIPFWLACMDAHSRDVDFVWKCIGCGWKQNRGRYKFCPKCGELMSAFPIKRLVCPECGKEISENWYYCVSCGASLRRG